MPPHPWTLVVTSGSARVCLYPVGQLELGHVSGSDGKHGHVCIAVAGDELDAVEVKERDQRNQGDALVPIDVRMVHQQAERIRGGQFRQPDAG